MVFFFSSRRRHTRSKRDWSSDVCSSDLAWMSCDGGVCARTFAGTSRGSQCASRFAKIDPKIATPNEPPIERKNVDVAVATPRRSEERRVGKEWKLRMRTQKEKNK